MTMQIAIIAFIASFACITGWLIYREPAQIDPSRTAGASQPVSTNKQDPNTKAARSSQKGEVRNQQLSEDELAHVDAERIIFNRLNNTVIPLVDFEDTSLEEALDFLRLRVRELASHSNEEARGISYIVRKPHVPAHGEEGTFEDELDPNTPELPNGHLTHKVTFQGRNISALEVLEEICRQTKLNWNITDHGVVIEPIE